MEKWRKERKIDRKKREQESAEAISGLKKQNRGIQLLLMNIVLIYVTIL